MMVALGVASTALAEAPAPSVHWGAIAFPDHDRTLEMGLTLNRFTEFDGAGLRYNNIEETAGLNFATLSWTERWSKLPGWTTNVTVGAGPTRDGLSRFLQNDVVHRFRALTPVPVDGKRTETDFMITASMTRWINLLGTRDQTFIGFGVATGTLYHEPYARVGFRRLALSDLMQSLIGTGRGYETFSNFVRVSLMGRYGRIFHSGAWDELSVVNYLAQASISIADYRNEVAAPPRWELEVAVTVDSGLYVDYIGKGIEERFVTLAVRVPYVTVETWNDLINQKDYGPTFGARLMLDLRQVYDSLKKPSGAI